MPECGMPLHVVLYEPEIPPNTGNIIRLCANVGAQLHLIEPLGYAWDDKKLRRAGLDYHALTHVTRHADWQHYRSQFPEPQIFGFTTKGSCNYTDARYIDDCHLLFGPETRGLPDEILAWLGDERMMRIPMVAGSRSMNLANAASVAIYEAWRQLDFTGASAPQ